MISHHPIEKCTEGERYTAQVPDTLDIAERMGLAVNALTGVWYPEEKWALGLDVDYSRRPAVLYPTHLTDAYLNIPAKFIEALVLSRLASGDKSNLNVDLEVLRVQQTLLGEDGLSYCPSGCLEQFDGERNFSEIWAEGRLMLMHAMLAQVDDDDVWAKTAQRKAERLLSLTREKDDFRFLWTGRFRPGDVPPADADEPTSPNERGSLAGRDPVFSMIYSVGAAGHGAGILHRATGHDASAELCRGLARWALARMFNRDDGRYTFWHFHHSLYALMAVCEYGLIDNDPAVMERVDACYRYMREMGDPLIGYFQEYVPGSDVYLNRHGNSVEICEVSDMVFLALNLTRAGVDDYWDDVDRYVRNMYAEGQIQSSDFCDHIPDSYFNPEPNTRLHIDDHNIAERSVGAFLGWMRANDGLTVTQTDAGPKLFHRAVQHCCTANGARTLYYVWDSIVTKSDDEVRVNLLLNRASPWLDVDSYVPADGKVVLRIKDAPRVAVRIPEWCDPHVVEASVGGKAHRTLVDGKWLRLGFLKPGDVVTLTFPIPERRIHRVIGEIPYTLTIRGSQVVDIDPKGVGIPLFSNPPTGKLVSKTRFIPKIGGITW